MNRVGFVDLDPKSSAPNAPYGIITADCSEPKEIDDGIFIERLDAETETYSVGVCVADTSTLYDDRGIFKQALANTEAKYFPLPNGEKGYDPMIDPEVIRDLEFTANNVRSALIVSFVVGKMQPPSELSVGFGHVEVVENMDYHDFDRRCQRRESMKPFARAGGYIMRHLDYISGGDDSSASDETARGDQYINMRRIESEKRWKRGAKLVEAYMVCAGHLVGKQRAEQGKLGIYRVHDPANETFIDLLPPNMALYSTTPGLHAGLNLDPYARVTSPLRRLEDYIMSHLLRLDFEGKQPTERDRLDVVSSVRELNRRVIREAPYSLALGRNELLGQGVVALGRAVCGDNVIPLPIDARVEATA